MDLKPKTKDNKIKIAILTILVLAASLFAWLVLKRAFYTTNVIFTVENSARFWQWFWIKAGWPLIALLAMCSFIILYLIAIKSRLIVFCAGVLVSAAFLFVFLTSNKLAAMFYAGMCIAFIGALVAADGSIQKEEKQRVNFSVKSLVKRGTATIIPVLIIMLSMIYYFSPLSREVKKISVPDNMIDTIIKAAGNISDTSADKTQDAQSFIKDYLDKNMPETKGMIDDSMIKDALKNIPSAGNITLDSSSSLVKDIKRQVNQQMDALFSKYYKHLPLLFTASFLFLLKFISAEFIWLVTIITTILAKICFALGIFDKEVEMVEKENLVF